MYNFVQNYLWKGEEELEIRKKKAPLNSTNKILKAKGGV